MKRDPNEKFTTVKLTDEQFKRLWDLYPHDEDFISEACRQALYHVHVPNRQGIWPKYGVRVYYDDGFMGSGYLLVHWEDSSKVPGCLSNGFMHSGGPRHDEVEWDDQPERERLQSIKNTLMEWAYGD